MISDSNYLGKLYKKISEPILKTENRINILDLGCGTGPEIEYIFKKAPHAHLTGIDMSGRMLDKLKERYKKALKQLLLIKGSYNKISFEKNAYDYVISAASLHLLLYTPKLKLYKKVLSALKKNGRFIEVNYFNKENEEKQIDIPFSTKKQKELMIEAGFLKARAIWNKKEVAIIVAEN